MKKLLLLFATVLLSIPGWASTKIEDLYYNLYDGIGTAVVTYEIFGNHDNYQNLSGEVTIPETVVFGGKTYSVTSIGDYAFSDSSGLISVTIPNSVTTIEGYAFSGCSGLTSVTIPNSVTSIGNYAFYGCSGLTSVTIPNSVTFIGDHAFYGCSSLKKSAYPDNLSKPFSNGVAIPYPKDGSFIEDGIIWGKDKEAIYFIPLNFTGTLTIPNSVTSIGNYAFYGCSGLTSVTIPNSVTTIGDWAFSDCSGLISVVIPKSITTIEDYAFGYCSGLTSVTIPDSVTEIGEAAFYDCSGLTSVTIPNSVTSIGGGAFYCCSGLTSVTIPNSVTSIEDYAFAFCTVLKSIVVDKGNPVFTSIDGIVYNKNLDTIICYPAGLTGGFEIPKSVTSIGDGAFSGCSGLTSVTIPNSVTSIGDWAFRDCIGLASVTIPNSVTSIGDWAFLWCKGLTSVFIGEKVRDIETEAFGYCTKLEKVTVVAPMPPMASEDIFDTIIFDSATLFVPENSMDSYKGTTPWSYFNSFKDINESGVEELAVDASETLYDVFNLNGQLLKRQSSQSDIDALAPGIYIIGGKKVIVK